MWHMSPTTCLLTLRALSRIRTEKHTLQNSPVNIGQGKPERISWLWSIIKCGDPLPKLCAKLGPACVHLVWVGGWVRMCSIGQVSSWPPYAELGAQAGSICRVNTQPQPQAAGPYKPHYSSRNHAGTHTHTQTYVVRDGHTWWSQGLSHNDRVTGALVGISEIHYGCLWPGVRWMLPTWIH